MCGGEVPLGWFPSHPQRWGNVPRREARPGGRSSPKSSPWRVTLRAPRLGPSQTRAPVGYRRPPPPETSLVHRWPANNATPKRNRYQRSGSGLPGLSCRYGSVNAQS
jgi:hypothetical protein